MQKLVKKGAGIEEMSLADELIEAFGPKIIHSPL